MLVHYSEHTIVFVPVVYHVILPPPSKLPGGLRFKHTMVLACRRHDKVKSSYPFPGGVLGRQLILEGSGPIASSQMSSESDSDSVDWHV